MRLPCYIGKISFSGNISVNGNSLAINHINHVRNVDELVLYNKNNGKYTHTNSYGTEILVQLLEGETWGVNKTVKAKIIKIETNKGNMSIPAGYAVLSGHGTAQTFLNTLAVNDEVNITQNILLDGVANPYSEIVGGDHRTMMLKNGVPTTDQIWNELHPRTAFGYSQDKKTSFHCVVDGRGTSAGVTTKELAELMLSAGAYDAINLDGGGSSCLYIKDFGPMNTPSDGSERAVGNSIFVVSNSPTDDTVSEIRAYETTIKLPHYGVFKPKFIGYNQYGMLISKDLSGVKLNCNSEVGFINEKGEFVASGTNGGILTANYNGITTTVRIEIVTDAEIAIRLDSVLIDNIKEYPIEVQSVIGLNTMLVYPDALTWTIRNPEICSVTQGVLKGLKNGITTVVGNLGSYKDSINVKVEIPESGKILFDNFNVNNWKFESSTALNATINNSNLPNGWTTGAAINYIYTSTRAPFLKLSRNIPLYSLPDTIKIGVNLGDITLSKAVLSLRANNIAQGNAKEFTTLPKNTDTEISLPLNDIFTTSDIAIYPIWFEYLNFYLATQTSGQAYTLGLKDITLCYKGIDITYTSPEKISLFQVYPNPATDELKIKLKDNMFETLNIKLLNLSGQTIKSWNTANYSQEIVLPLKEVLSGTYLLQVQHSNNSSETIKIIKK